MNATIAGRRGSRHCGRVAAGRTGQVEAALALAGRLLTAGLRVLVDDRPQVSVGVKLTDAELIGVPRTVVLGRRLSEGYAEVRDRRSGDRSDVPLADVVGHLVNGV